MKEQHEKQLLCSLPTEVDAAAMEDVTTSEQESDVQDVSADTAEDSKLVSFDEGETEREEDSEQNRNVDETSLKHRSKRESRRMRELEQAQFSLELLKVRSTSVGAPVQEDLGPDASTCQLDENQTHSPRGSPASHGSFEMLSVEDMETDGSAQQEQTQALDSELHEGLTDSNHNEKPATEPPNKTEGPRATFYIASDQSPLHEPKFESPNKSHKERRESTSRRPVVVLISMQKESPLEEGELLAAQTQEVAFPPGAASSHPQTAYIAGLEVGSALKEPHGNATQSNTDESSSTEAVGPEVEGICASEVDIQIVLEPKPSVPAVVPSQPERNLERPVQEAPSPVLDTKPPKAQKKSSAQTVIVNMMEKPSNTVFSPPRRKLPFSK